MARMGRPSVYPWDTWLDGERHVLQPGVDFRIDTRMMRQVILGEARRRQLPVATRVKQGWIEVKLRVDEQRGRRKHDWDTIFEKSPAVLEEGRDFEGDIEAFVAAARNAASRRNLRLNVTVANGVVSIFSYRNTAKIGASATEMASRRG